MKSTPRFHELEPQTNLNQPPSNWLIKDERLNFPQRFYFFDFFFSNFFIHFNFRFMDSSNFSSFNIAEKSLDSIGSVDVVSDAENIKTVFFSFFSLFFSFLFQPLKKNQTAFKNALLKFKYKYGSS